MAHDTREKIPLVSENSNRNVCANCLHGDLLRPRNTFHGDTGSLPVLLMKCFEDWKHNKVRFLITASAFGVLFLFLLQLQLSFRVSGSSSELPQLLLLKWVTLEDTTDMFSETVFSLKLVPSLHDYFKESVLVQFLVSPIPRFIWPSKPASQVVWYYTLHRWGINIYEGEETSSRVLSGTPT